MTTARFPRGLRASGRRLWTAYDGEHINAGKRQVLLEACRLADRLDRLDELLRGDADAWAQVVVIDEDVHEYTLKINGAMTQARLHASTLAGLLNVLGEPSKGVKPVSGTTTESTEGATRLDEFRQRRASGRQPGPTDS